jgi:prepilin-type N-terminal cleavage/methylation domain-containing protein
MKIHSLQKGFTLIELLVVIVVIGILAAIVVVSYNGTQSRAFDTAVTSDLSNLSDQLEIFRTHSGTDRYPSTAVELQTIGAKFTQNSYKTAGVSDNGIICMAADFKTFTIIALSKSGNVLAATKDGMATYPQAPSTFGTAACTSVYSMNPLFSAWQSSTWQGWATSG